MKPSLETLYATTFRVRIAAGDTPDLAQSAALAAVHRAGMEDAAGIVDKVADNEGMLLNLYACQRLHAAADAIRRAAGGYHG